jgi:hypothetical protein
MVIFLEGGRRLLKLRDLPHNSDIVRQYVFGKNFVFLYE